MYNELYAAWKAEKTSSNPQPLPSDFYVRASSYLKSLAEDSASSDGNTLQGTLLNKEKTIATRLLQELRQARLHKLVEKARNGGTITQDGLTEEEQALVKRLSDSLNSFIENTPDTKRESFSEAQSELVVVRFIQDIPEIVGVDLKIYGPYKKEDVGSLPTQNARALIKQGAAKQIEVRGIS